MDRNEGVGSGRMDLTGRRATLLGLGARTTVELARFLVRRGAIVTISDQKPRSQLGQEITLLGDLPVKLELGGHLPEHVADAEFVFVSPGVPRDLPILAYALERGARVSSEIELLFSECTSPIVGITGSSGKTTTTTLAGLMLLADGRRTFVGGNIGVPLINRVDEIGSDSAVVLELSSFQLESMTVSPHVAAVLNVTPNHLDRHGTMAAYTDAKANILRFQSSADIAILGADDPVALSLLPMCRGHVHQFSLQHEVDSGAFVSDDWLITRRDGVEQAICTMHDIRLRGRHNRLNVLAAATIAGAAGASAEAIRAVATTFTGVGHRIEPVRMIGGVTWFNDSIATTPERTCAALTSFSEPIVLLAGGKSKHLPLDEMCRLIVDRCRAVVTFGQMAEEIEAALARTQGSDVVQVARSADLDGAVRAARGLAAPGDVVLLSPSGTSFDAYRDFEARGEHFRELVAALG